MDENVQFINQLPYFLTLAKYWKSLCIIDYIIFCKKSLKYHKSPEYEFQQKYSTTQFISKSFSKFLSLSMLIFYTTIIV